MMRVHIPLLMLAITGSCMPVAAAGVHARMESNRETLASQADTMQVRDVVLSHTSVDVYDRLEVRFSLDATYTNPYDPAEIDVVAELEASDGTTLLWPAFFITPYESQSGHTQLTGRVRYVRAGESTWAARIAVREPGDYRIRIQARTGETGEQARSDWFAFQATEPDQPPAGFVEVSPTNPSYFRNSGDGTLFYGVGSNIAWTRQDEGPEPTYEHYLAAAGPHSTATRIWQCHWAWLEWTPHPDALDTPEDSAYHYAGLNYYNQPVATAFDRIFELAEAQGLRIMLTLDNNNEQFRHESTWGNWAGNPYNTAWGGPVDEPDDIFSSPEARQAYQNRLRYILARWGYSTSLWALNSWNDRQDPSANVIDWVAEMREYVHAVIGQARPIIYGSNFRGRGVETGADYAQTRASGLYPDKPSVTQEVYWTRDEEWFNETLVRHLWQTAARGVASVMVWPHPIVDRQNSWPIFQSLADFLQPIPLHATRWEPIEITIDRVDAEAGSFRHAFAIAPYGDVGNWADRASRDHFIIDPGQGDQFLEGFAPKLYGLRRERVDWRTEPTLTFQPPLPPNAQMILNLSEVSGRSVLAIKRGEETILEHPFPGSGRRVPDPVTVPLPDGADALQLELNGPASDWLGIREIFFVFDSTDLEQLPEALGQRAANGSHGFFYLYNPTYGELSHKLLQQPPRPLHQVQLTIHDLKPERSYSIERYDVDRGRVQATWSRQTDAEGSLRLQIESVARDAAVRIQADDR